MGGESFPRYATVVDVWRKVANLEVVKRTSALVSQTESTARDVCTATGSGKLMEPDAVGWALRPGHFGPRLPKCGKVFARHKARCVHGRVLVI